MSADDYCLSSLVNAQKVAFVVMDCSPLNLAHFHERRADKFIKHHRYDDAYKAVETSLLYLQDAYKNVIISKSIEVLDTQKWEYERKLRQIQIRRQQHERPKLKEILPLAETNATVVVRPDSSVTIQSVAKSIDKTIKEFDAKFSLMLEEQVYRLQLSKENQGPIKESVRKQSLHTGSEQDVDEKQDKEEEYCKAAAHDDMPSLAPLELPAFDFTSAPSLATIAGLTESFHK